jgi:hypothetical protein
VLRAKGGFGRTGFAVHHEGRGSFCMVKRDDYRAVSVNPIKTPKTSWKQIPNVAKYSETSVLV